MSGKVKQNKADSIFDIINIALLSIVLIVVLYPLIFVVSASFSDTMQVMQGKVWLFPKGINLEAYKAVFRDRNILIGYRNTIMYTVIGTAVNIILTIAAAYPLSRKDFAGRNIITIFFAFTMFFSGGLIPNYLLIKKIGLYNNFWVMVLPGAVGVWNMTIMRTFFQNTIPYELQEAAVIDGCTNIGILTKVILPLSTPIIAVMVIFYGVGHWNAFFSALIYLKDRSKFPLQLVLREILIQNNMSEMMESGDSIVQQQMLAEGIKYAVIIVSSIPVLMLYPFLQRYFVKGVMVGAIKG